MVTVWGLWRGWWEKGEPSSLIPSASFATLIFGSKNHSICREVLKRALYHFSYLASQRVNSHLWLSLTVPGWSAAGRSGNPSESQPWSAGTLPGSPVPACVDSSHRSALESHSCSVPATHQAGTDLQAKKICFCRRLHTLVTAGLIKNEYWIIPQGFQSRNNSEYIWAHIIFSKGLRSLSPSAKSWGSHWEDFQLHWTR